MISFITSIDFYSSEVYFTINNGSSRHKTIFGGLLSLVSLAAMIALCIYFSIEFFKGASSSVISKDNSTEDIMLPLYNFPFMLRLSTEKVTVYEDADRLYSISLKLKVGGGDNLLQWADDIEMETCDINKHFGEHQHLFTSIEDLQAFFCPVIRMNNQSISGVYGGEKVFQYYHFYIASCVNSTAKTDCLAQENINKLLKSTYLDVRSLDYNIDSNTKEGVPYSIYIRSDRHSISNTVYKRIWMYMESIDYYKDLGLVFEDNVKYSFYQVDSFRYDMDLRDMFNGVTTPGTFANLSILNQANRRTYNQTYTKAQEFFANMGGIIKIISVICLLVNYFISESTYQQKIMSYFFPYKKEKTDETHPTTNKMLNQTSNNYTATSFNKYLKNDLSSIKNGKSFFSSEIHKSKIISMNQRVNWKNVSGRYQQLSCIDLYMSKILFSKEKQKMYLANYCTIKNILDISRYIQLQKSSDEIMKSFKLNNMVKPLDEVRGDDAIRPL